MKFLPLFSQKTFSYFVFQQTPDNTERGTWESPWTTSLKKDSSARQKKSDENTVTEAITLGVDPEIAQNTSPADLWAFITTQKTKKFDHRP